MPGSLIELEASSFGLPAQGHRAQPPPRLGDSFCDVLGVVGKLASERLDADGSTWGGQDVGAGQGKDLLEMGLD